MSSHHFVKEGQEPAVLIAEPVSLSLIEPLLEWAPQVIVFEDLVEEILLWGIKIDVVISTSTPSDSLREKLLSQVPVKILQTGRQDALETALHFLISTKQTAVTLLVEDPASYFDRLENFRDKINITLLTEHVKWSGISSGSYKKWLSGGSVVYFIGNSEPDIAEGLKKSDNHYEVLGDGFIELAAKEPFWIGEAN